MGVYINSDHRYPEFCRVCKMYSKVAYNEQTEIRLFSLPAHCIADYRNPAKNVEAGVSQLLHGGEFPCSRHPERHKIDKAFRLLGHKLILPLFATQYVSRIPFRIKKEKEEEV